jgi:hypothetical protein
MIPDTILRRWAEDPDYFEVRTTLLNETYTERELKESLAELKKQHLIDYKWISDGEHLVVKINSNEVVNRNLDTKKSRFLD